MTTGLRVGLLVMAFAARVSAQILHAEDLNTEQYRKLDRAKTVVLFTGTLLEEHGPYLPAGTDGFVDQRLTSALAKRLVAERRGWTVLLMPPIPLGTGQANSIGFKYSFPGSFTVRAETLRAVYMDLVSQLGEQGFKYVFVVDDHGAPGHNAAIQQAADYFNETYHGAMAVLFNLMPVREADMSTAAKVFTKEEAKKEGFTVHAGGDETSSVLYVRPDLVAPAYRKAPPVHAENFADQIELASKPDWPGYFGAPSVARAAVGKAIFDADLEQMMVIARKVLDGGDISKLPRYSDVVGGDPATARVVEGSAKFDDEVSAKERAWLQRHGAR